jgi:hypothetical protein
VKDTVLEVTSLTELVFQKWLSVRVCHHVGHRVHASYLFPDATIDSHTKRDDVREPLGLSYSSMSFMRRGAVRPITRRAQAEPLITTVCLLLHNKCCLTGPEQYLVITLLDLYHFIHSPSSSLVYNQKEYKRHHRACASAFSSAHLSHIPYAF